MEEQALFDAFQQVQRQMRRSLAQDSEQTTELAPSQARLLRVLGHHGGSSQKELAAFMRIRPASLSEVLNKLEQKQLITKEQNPVDRRRNRYFLTEPGTELSERLKKERRHQGGAFFTVLNQTEQEQLLAILTKLGAKTDNEERQK